MKYRMKPNRLALAAGCLSIVLGILGTESAARADTPNNTAGEYYIEDSADALIYFGSSTNSWLYAYNSGGTYAYLDSWIDTAGSLTNYFGASNFQVHATAVSGVSAQLKISDFSGTVDFWAGTPFNFTITASVYFTGTGITPPCHTPSFTVTIDVTNSAGSWVPAGTAYGGGSSPTGKFRATNTDFVIPAITSGCGGGAVINALNSDFDLGVPDGSHDEIVWYGTVSPTGQGSP